jgi:hypothetical protein
MHQSCLLDNWLCRAEIGGSASEVLSLNTTLLHVANSDRRQGSKVPGISECLGVIVRWILVWPYDLPTLWFGLGRCNNANAYPAAKTGPVTPPCVKSGLIIGYCLLTSNVKSFVFRLLCAKDKKITTNHGRLKLHQIFSILNLLHLTAYKLYVFSFEFQVCIISKAGERKSVRRCKGATSRQSAKEVQEPWLHIGQLMHHPRTWRITLALAPTEDWHSLKTGSH